MKTERLPEEIRYIDNDFLINDDFSKISIPCQPFKIAGVVMLLCLKGSATVKLSIKKYTISENQFLMILPMQILEYVDRTPDFNGRIIVVSIKFMENLKINVDSIPRGISFFFQIKDNPVITLEPQELRTLLEYYDFLAVRADISENIYRREIIFHLLRAMILEWVLVFHKHHRPVKSKKTRKDELLEEFLLLVTKHYKTHRNIDFYAQKLSITSKHLSTSIKEVSGELAGEWISKYVIMDAKVLLNSTNLTVQQIADSLNFPNQSFFGKYFKRHVGMSPNEYRKIEE